MRGLEIRRARVWGTVGKPEQVWYVITGFWGEDRKTKRKYLKE